MALALRHKRILGDAKDKSEDTHSLADTQTHSEGQKEHVGRTNKRPSSTQKCHLFFKREGGISCEAV